MRARILLIGLVFMIMISSALAAVDDANASWSGNNLLDDSGNSFTLTANGDATAQGATYKVGNGSFSLDGTGDYLSRGDEPEWDGSELGVCTWVRFNTISGGGQGIVYRGTFANNFGTWSLALNNPSSGIFFRLGSSGGVTSTTVPTTGTWYHVCGVNDGTNSYIYFNGALEATQAESDSLTAATGIILGGYYSSSYVMDGYLDQTMIFSHNLTAADISELYNSGNGYDPYAPDVANFTIYAQDAADLSNITVFNATVNGTDYVAVNGSVVTPYLLNETNILNITVVAENYQDYTNTAYNTTNGDLTAPLTPNPLLDFSLITPNVSETNETSYNVSWTEASSPTGKQVTYNGSIAYLSNGTVVGTFSTTNLSYVVDLSGYYSDNYSVSVNATEQYTNNSFEHNSSLLYNGLNYFYFYNEQSGNPIENGNITINFPNLATNQVLVTDSLGKVTFESYINDTKQTGVYNITFEDLVGYETPVSFSRNYSSLPVNESFNITTTNIVVSIYYRSNFSDFTRTANVIIEGVNNYTTTTGAVVVENATMTAGDYRITVSSDGFFNEEKTFTFTGQANLSLNLYMLELNESNSGTVTIRTVDEFSRLLDNAEVNLLEYDTSTLSYLEVSECYTDSNGECKFLVETNTKSYKFTASRVINGNTVTATTGAQIFEDTIVGGETVVFNEETITLTLSSTQTAQLSQLQNIIFDITPYEDSFNNVTNQSNIAVTFNSIDGQNVEVCVEYFEFAGGVKTSLTNETFCLVGSSGEVTENAFFTLNRSKTYVADIYLKNDFGNFNLDSYVYHSDSSFLERLEQNAILPYFIIFIWIFLLAGSLMLKNVSLTGIAVVVGAWVLWFFFPSGIMVSVAVLQTVIGANIIYVGRKKEDFN